MPRGNPQNMRPMNIRTKEEQKKIASKGGINSGKARRRKKSLQELTVAMLESNVDAKKVKSVQKLCKDLDTEDINVMAAMVAGQANSAIKGNTSAFQILTDLAEQGKSSNKDHYNLPAKDIGSSFVDMNRDIDERGHLEYWLAGGRGSLKSTFISLKIIELMKNNPDMCCIVVRRVAATMRDSVYSQLQWAISNCELDADFKSTVNPLEIVMKKTGQKIYFRGADEPEKIKSIRPPLNMHIGIIWYEECDQMAGMAEIRNIDQSVMRGGDDFIKFVSYNTPISKLHWINQEAALPKPNRLFSLTNYLKAPVQWLGKPFMDEAKWLRDTNIKAFKHEYLGLAVGLGTTVFENVRAETITDEQIASFDHIYQGIDWGWFPDPFHWGKMDLELSRRTLYIYDEFRTNKMRNEDTWSYLHDHKGVNNVDLITADSAENKSISDFRSYGSNTKGAEKGPNSIHEGIKWLQSLNAIIIDPVRCPETYKEFSKYQYELTKDGEPISAYPDENNHSIDMTRYALERVWKRKGN